MHSHLGKLFFLTLLLFSITETAKASHIMGGEITYLYLDRNGPVDAPYRYKIKLNIYSNCDTNSQFKQGILDPIPINIYYASDGSLDTTYYFYATVTDITPTLPPGCSASGLAGVCVKQNTVEQIINLPLSFSGFYVEYNSCCRNASIVNLSNPGGTGNIFYTFIPATINRNSSPQFNDIPVPYICLNDTNTILNSAFDPDGDQLIYSFARPYDGDQNIHSNFNPSPALANYNSGFSFTQPFSASGYANVNASNGLTSYKSAMNGNYVVVVEIKEYRTINGVQTLLSSTRRDLQILVGNCNSNDKPQFTSNVVTYNLQAGDNVCFNIGAKDVNNDSVTLKATSRILDGSSGYTGPLATFNNNIKGKSSVSSQLCWSTTCSTVGSYNIYASAKDNGCPPKTNNAIYTINVSPFTGPTQIFGSDTLCNNNTSAIYRISGFSNNVTKTWSVTNGTVTSTSAFHDTVYVTWSSSIGTKSISVTVTTPGGCSATKSKNVFVKQGSGTIAATPHNVIICQGSSVQLNASGGTNYIWSPATGLSNAAISNPVANPNATTKYKVTESGAGTCSNFDSVLVTVIPNVAAAGSDKTLCSGSSAVIGSDSVAGYHYYWTPKTGISDTTASKPSFTASNNTGSPVVTKYVQTAVNRATGCTSRDTVIITENPLPLAIAGPDKTLCSGDTLSIGAAAVNGTSYLWSPAAGLNSSASSKPVVSLTNNTTGVLSTQYILTSTTTATGCKNKDTVVVSVVPKAANAGIDQTFCGQAAAVIGSDSVTGFRYRWTPITGLSDSLFSKPTATLTNNSNNSLVIFYIQTAIHRASGCVFKDTMEMIVNPLPLAIAGPDKIICSGDSVSIGSSAVSGTSYSWTPATGLNFTNVSNPLVKLINNATLAYIQQYILTSTINATGCQKKDTVLVTVNPLPIVSAGADKIFCSGDTVSIGGASSANTGYVWLPVTGLSSDTISNPSLSLKNNGAAAVSGIYIVTATNKITSCINKDTLLITVNPLPSADAGAGKVFCSGDSVQLGAAAIPGDSYLWIPSTGLSNGVISNPKLGLKNNTNTPDTISYILKEKINVTGCIKYDTVRVIVNPLPIALLSGSAGICSADTMTIGLDSISNYSYQWNPSTGLSKPSSAKSILKLSNTGASPDTNYYVRTVTSTLTSCVNKDSVKVIIRPRPGLFPISGSRSVCPGVQQVDYWINAVSGSSYQWYVKGGTITSGSGNDSIKVDWGIADDSALVKMIPINSYGCPGDTNFIIVKIKIQLETATPTGIDTVCFNSAGLIKYQTVNTTGSIYTWKTAGINSTILSGDSTSSVQVDWQGTGVGKIWIDLEQNTTPTNYCTGSSDTLFVKINTSPDSTLKINGAISLCENVQGSSYTFHGLPASSYQWNINPSSAGTIVSGNNSDSIVINWGPADTITLSVRETTVNGCVGKLIDTTIILHPSPNTSLTGNNVNVCPENISGQVYTAHGLAQSVFQWTVTGGSINGSNGKDSVNVDWSANAVSRSISVIETTEFGCSAQAASQSFVFDPSVIAIKVISDEYSDERYIEIKWEALFTSGSQLTISRRQANVPGSVWVVAAIVPGTDSVYLDGILSTDSSDYEYKISGINSCGNEIVSSPTHKNILLMNASQTQSDLGISWTKYIGWPVKQYEIWRQLDNGTYILYAVSDSSTLGLILQNGAADGFHQCFRINAVEQGTSGNSWSNDVCFDFINDLFIPNLVTPNNDGENDVFKIKNIHLYPDNSIIICNQWGESVYRKEGYNNEWTADVSDGVYYYYLTIGRTGKEYKGWVHVLK
jgi:gliding motility-associated-like protein